MHAAIETTWPKERAHTHKHTSHMEDLPTIATQSSGSASSASRFRHRADAGTSASALPSLLLLLPLQLQLVLLLLLLLLLAALLFGIKQCLNLANKLLECISYDVNRNSNRRYPTTKGAASWAHDSYSRESKSKLRIRMRYK